MTGEPEVDAFEKRLRFGCGFIFGSTAGLLLIAHWVHHFTGMHGLAVFGIATLCGILAMRYGTTFWYWASEAIVSFFTRF